MISGVSRAPNIIKRAQRSISFVCFPRQRSLCASFLLFTWARVEICIPRMAARGYLFAENSWAELNVAEDWIWSILLPAFAGNTLTGDQKWGDWNSSPWIFAQECCSVEVYVHFNGFSPANLSQNSKNNYARAENKRKQNEIATLCIETGANERH